MKERDYIKREVKKPVHNRKWLGGPVGQKKKDRKIHLHFSQVSVQGLTYKDQFCNPRKAAKCEIYEVKNI